MGLWDSIKKIGRDINKGFNNAVGGIGEGLQQAAPFLTKLPGPIGTAAKIYTIGSGLFGGKPHNPSNDINNLLQQGANSQMDFQNRALNTYQQNMDKATAMSIADNQSIYDLARNQFNNQIQNSIPYIQASQGALQNSLPAIEYLLGLTPTKLDMGYNVYQAPERNLVEDYRKTADELNPATSSSKSGITGGPANQPAGGQQVIKAEADPNYSYDIKESPLYQWQKDRMEENLQGQLAAAGLANSTYAQRELTRAEQGLAAQERDRTLGNLYQLANLGMQGQNFNSLKFNPTLGGLAPQLAQNQASGMAAIYGNMGGIQGQLNSQLAQNQLANYNAKMQSHNLSNPMGTALDLAHQFGWLGGGKADGGFENLDLGFNIGLNGIGGLYDDAASLLDFGF